MNAIKLKKNDQKTNYIEINHEKDQRDRTIFKLKNSYVTETKP